MQVKFEAISTMAVRFTVIWDVKPCRLVDIYLYFGRQCYLLYNIWGKLFQKSVNTQSEWSRIFAYSATGAVDQGPSLKVLTSTWDLAIKHPRYWSRENNYGMFCMWRRKMNLRNGYKYTYAACVAVNPLSPLPLPGRRRKETITIYVLRFSRHFFGQTACLYWVSAPCIIQKILCIF
jgi:hypothetical protein